MDTIERETNWKRAGDLAIETRTALPNVVTQPPFDARGLVVAGELTLAWQG
jgi:hypothetical protein